MYLFALHIVAGGVDADVVQVVRYDRLRRRFQEQQQSFCDGVDTSSCESG